METESTPPDGREYTLQEAAELVGRDYGYVCSVVKDLDLGHLEERRPGSKGPQRRLLNGPEIAQLLEHFETRQSPGAIMQLRKSRKKFLKIKYSQGKKASEVLIKWDEPTPMGGYETQTLSCDEDPRPEFLAALGALVDHVPSILQVPPDYTEDMVVNGIWNNYDEYGERATGIMAVKELPNTLDPLVPNVPAVFTSEESPLTLCVEELEREAERYINGARAQLSLDFSGEALQAARELRQVVEDSGSSMTITHGDRSVTLGRQEEVAH